MAFYYTWSKAQRPSEYSDVEPSNVAPVAATSSLTSVTVGPNVAAVGGPESMSTEPAEPVPAPSIPVQREGFPSRAHSVWKGLRVLFEWGLRPGVPQRSSRPV